MVDDGERSGHETRALLDDPSACLASGALIAERYELRGILGAGGMGIVYRAFDRQIADLVALKILQTDGETSPTLIERFRREARLARRVTHANAARVYDLGVEHGRWFLTMELVDGESLQALLERETSLPLRRSCEIATDICAGLGAIHKAGVVHRDLKPGNVLLERGGRVVITDFGIARQLVPSADEPLKTRGMLGTPLYMAPEQATNSRAIDVRADLYALGVMLYRMLTGQLPAERRQSTPDPRDVLPLPAELAEFVARCMSFEPDHRPASAEKCGILLRRFAQGSFDRDTTLPSQARRARPDPKPQVQEHGHPREHENHSRSRLRGPGERALVVLPFRMRGQTDDAYLATALSEELADILSQTRGLWVISGGAAAAFAEARDPRAIGRELGVDVVVDGTVQRVGSALRITARLHDVIDGTQLWSGRFDGAFTDVFELQDRMARQLAEALRVELTMLAFSETTSPEAIELYLRGRHKTRGIGTEQRAAVDLFERCLQLCPDFKPAIAASALASLRAGFFEERSSGYWKERAKIAVEHACNEAPGLVETQIAIGVSALQVGSYARSVRALTRAIEIAPTCAVAHQYLGLIKAEAGYAAEGMEELKLAYELDKTLRMCLYEQARLTALLGDTETYELLLARLKRAAGITASGQAMLEMRVANWKGDRARAQGVLDKLLGLVSPEFRMATLFGQAVTADADDDSAITRLLQQARAVANSRLCAFVTQLTSEVLAVRGQPKRALEVIQNGTRGMLIDIVWLELCPVFSELRRLDGYAEIESTIRSRARAVWS